MQGGALPLKQEWQEFNREAAEAATEKEGVYEIGDQEQAVIYIHGTDNIRRELLDHFEDGFSYIEPARFFRYEEAFMYTSKENEQIRLFMRKTDQLPKFNQELI
jgi:excinuclease UvrABC nuclease subunit